MIREHFKIIDRSSVRPNYIGILIVAREQFAVKVAIKSQEMSEFPRETGGGRPPVG